MGRELVSGSPSPDGGAAVKPVPVSFTKEFYKHLPFYLSIGMSAAEYFDGAPELARAYRRAEELRKKRRNTDAWLAGAYFYEALCDAAPILRLSFSPAKAHPYLAEPYPLTRDDARRTEQKKERGAMERAAAHVTAWAAGVNSRRKARKESAGNG